MEFNENDYDIKVSGELNEIKPDDNVQLNNDSNQAELLLEELFNENFDDQADLGEEQSQRRLK